MHRTDEIRLLGLSMLIGGHDALAFENDRTTLYDLSQAIEGRDRWVVSWESQVKAGKFITTHGGRIARRYLRSLSR